MGSQIGKEERSGDMRKLLKMIRRVKDNNLKVRMERLWGKVEIETYMDTSFGNVKEGRKVTGGVCGWNKR